LWWRRRYNLGRWFKSDFNPKLLRQRSFAEACTFTDICEPDHNSVTSRDMVQETAFSDTEFFFEDMALELKSPDRLATVYL
jgi:hypothetical protein